MAGWLLPGLGYWLIGERARAWWGGGAVLALFVGALFVAGIRTIDVPGFDHQGRSQVAALRSRPIAGTLAKPYYLGQIFVGPTTVAGSYLSVSAGRAGVMRASAKLDAVASLATAVAGILNLLILIDAAARAKRLGEGAGS